MWIPHASQRVPSLRIRGDEKEMRQVTQNILCIYRGQVRFTASASGSKGELLSESDCLAVGKRANDKLLVLPSISYGLNRHHFDFTVSRCRRT